MLKGELELSNDPERDKWAKHALFDRDDREKIMTLLQESDNTEEFIQKLFADKELRMSRGYAEVSKLAKRHGDRVEQMTDKWITVEDKDNYYLLIGDRRFHTRIMTGASTDLKYAVVDPGEINGDMLRCFGYIEGEAIEIHSRQKDIDSEVIEILSGKYCVYFGNGKVVFVRA